VCIRAFPADSFEYFGEMALGNIAFVVVAGIARGVANRVAQRNRSPRRVVHNLVVWELKRQAMIRVELPSHLRTLAKVDSEVELRT
jgi:hypothetical protein